MPVVPGKLQRFGVPEQNGSNDAPTSEHSRKTTKVVRAFWNRFRESDAAQRHKDPRLYDTMRVGSSAEDADRGAALILENWKTATSSHPDEYDANTPPPFVGALSVVLDGSDLPVAVVETTEVELRRIADIDEAFAGDYGEWDGTAATLKSQLEAFHRDRAAGSADGAGPGMQLLCERFRVIYKER